MASDRDDQLSDVATELTPVAVARPGPPLTPPAPVPPRRAEATLFSPVASAVPPLPPLPVTELPPPSAVATELSPTTQQTNSGCRVVLRVL